MSCTCQTSNPSGTAFACECDNLIYPSTLRIGAGLTHLPRQIAGFPEFRRAMLHAIPLHPALTAWRARNEDDLGVMLLEMWAYVCDSLSFYDEVIAHETFLRTARRRPSQRRLVALLGYLPAPAVAATVRLAVFADGRLPVLLPAGTAFRSGGFDGNPPQVFELDKDTLIHPLTNRWMIRAPHPGVVPDPDPNSFLVILQTEIKPDALLLLLDTGFSTNNQAVWVSRLEPYTGADNQVYNKLIFKPKLGISNTGTKLLGGTPLARLKLFQAAESAALWTLDTTEKAVSDDGRKITLNVLNRQIKRDDYVIITRGSEARWYRVAEVEEAMRTTVPPSILEVNNSRFNIPGTKTPVTEIELDVPLNTDSRKAPSLGNWTNDTRKELRVYFNLQPAATIIDEPKTFLSPNDALIFAGRIEQPVEDIHPGQFFLQDKNTRSVLIKGEIDFPGGLLSKNTDEKWAPDLSLPVEAYGNVVELSRGEQVHGEILGSGNASAANQTFKLKKKPLTYLSAPTADNDRGIKNTLLIYVNGIRWTEVSSFYGKKHQDQVYIVRQNDENDTLVTFGDGIRGARLPSGRDNIMAHYRFGAGLAAPPAGSINQIAKPVKGLQSVKNPLPASGGDDAEKLEDIRLNAPKTALILGRAVSIQDMEAVALSMPGVRAVQLEWRWHGQRQQTVVHVWYIGEEGLKKKLYQRLINVCDPCTPFQIEQALARKIFLVIDVVVDPRYVKADVMTTLQKKLSDPQTGLLTPEQLGIGRPLFRSRIFEAVLAVEGVTAVRNLFSILLDTSDLTFPVHGLSSGLARRYAITPGAGYYFDFSITLNH